MNISYNWLKDLINVELSPIEVGEQLTRVGLAVEGIHEFGNDFVLDIDLTSNRPDCLSHLGVARELGVITETPLNERAAKYREVPLPAVLAGEVVTIEAPELCNRFTARIIRNVKIGPSPQWLVDRLEAIGERSINNVADITNYVMHELGQPMHAFDLDKLAGGRIIVRRAKDGETITTLDEVERTLSESMLAICDAEKPAAVAGIMGGLGSSISDDTVNVLLEVAYFDRENIRATSRKLNLATEASYRFERGVDVENLINASNRATQLICDLADGSAGDLIDIYPVKKSAIPVISNDISGTVRRLTGLAVAAKDCIRILSALGIRSSESETDPEDQLREFLSPTWRHDIAIEEDLVEEIARHAGYENIGTELPPAYGAGEYQANEQRLKRLRQTLTDTGFDEAISYSFIDTKYDGKFKTVPGISQTDLVTLNDSVIEGAVRMRPTLIPGLLAAVRHNFNQQRRNLKLYEIGKAFSAGDGYDELPNEKELLAMVLTGSETYEDRAMTGRELDFFDAKGSVEAALSAAGIENVKCSADMIDHLRPGQSADIKVGGETVGYLGRLSDEISATNKFRQPVFVAEVNLDLILDADVKTVVYKPLPKFPGISRDVSFIVKRNDVYSDLVAELETLKGGHFRDVKFVDIYEGAGIAEDERSLTVRLEYRSDDRTLTEAEVEALHDQIVKTIGEKLGIHPRI